MARLRCRFVQCCRDRFGRKNGNSEAGKAVRICYRFVKSGRVRICYKFVKSGRVRICYMFVKIGGDVAITVTADCNIIASRIGEYVGTVPQAPFYSTCKVPVSVDAELLDTDTDEVLYADLFERMGDRVNDSRDNPYLGVLS